MKHFLKSFLAKLAAILALALVGMIIYSATSGGLATIPETVAGAVISPLQTAVTAVTDSVSAFFGNLTGGYDLQQRIAQLEKENADRRQKLVETDKLRQENNWYGEILGLHEEHSDYTFAAARVIGRDPSDPYGNITIFAGRNHGVSVNDPVVTTDGCLVGVVEQVAATYSQVRTVLDPTAKVSVQISRTGDTAYTDGSTVAQARERILRLSTLERSSGAAIGDYLTTSGIGGIYPEGLLIGSVRSVTGAADGITLNAEIDLFADIFDLKQVMIITSFDGQQSEREAPDGEASR